MTQTRRIHVTHRSPWARFWRLLQLSAVATYRDNCLGIAKGVAYSGLLSFFPVLTTLATLLVQANAAVVARSIAAFLYEVVPPGTEDVVRMLFIVQGRRPASLLVVAVVVATWAASGAIMSLMEGFRSIYDIPAGRGFVKDRGIAVLLVFLSVVPAWGVSALIVLGVRSEQTVMYWLGGAELTGSVKVVGQILRYVVALSAFVLVTALMYFVGPNRKQSFRRVLPGAMLATVLWLIATAVFGWWVRYVANYNVLYGSVGAGLALLAWMYVLAVITFYGCEFNAIREKLHPRRAARHANPHAA